MSNCNFTKNTQYNDKAAFVYHIKQVNFPNDCRENSDISKKKTITKANNATKRFSPTRVIK